MENKTETQKNEYKTLLLSTERQGMTELIEWLETTDFFTAPASTRFHGNYEAALCEHSLKVYKTLYKMNNVFALPDQKIPKDSIIISSLLHDICKANFYIKSLKNVKDGKKLNYQKKEVDNWIEKEVYTVDDKTPMGHSEKSVILTQRFIKLTDLEIYLILIHMGITDSTKNYINGVLKLYPSAILLHLSDFLSSSLYEKTIE